MSGDFDLADYIRDQVCCPRIHGCELGGADECPAEKVRASLLRVTEERDEALSFAEDWHRCVETILTVCGLSCTLGVEEAAQQVREHLDDREDRLSATAVRWQADRASLSALRGEVGKVLGRFATMAKHIAALDPSLVVDCDVSWGIAFGTDGVRWEQAVGDFQAAASLLSTLEGNTVSRAIIAGSNSTVATDNPSSTGKEG